MRMIASLFDTFGEYIKFWIGPDLNIAVKNPADVKVRPTWRLHRKIATPSYNKKAVSMFMQVFNEESEELIRVLSKKGPETYDIYYDVVQRTTSTVCQTLMGVPKEEVDDLECLQEVIEITPKVYDLIFKRMTQWWLQVPIIYWWSGNLKIHKNYAETLNKFVEDLVGKRRKALEKHEGPEESMGIVDRYILSGELTDQEVKWESFSLFTTERVYNEVMEVIGPEEHVTTQHLKQLHCMDMVYKETLRYFSIAGFIQRTVEEEITIKDGRVYATAMIKTMVVHVIRKFYFEAEGPVNDIDLEIAISVRAKNGYRVRTRPRSTYGNHKMNGLNNNH
ncbi:unnamed protein product [Diatraea saccharalis]|uniref:Uncharacterized protein n=1 Tax=Diatraea saccharalis TaxID=40085 RepID=A0A9N9R7V2_9NEOP|nr:unnamed protein product [Diatraea saccharalis]